MLSFKEFQEYVEMNLEQHISPAYKNAKISLNEVVKNNGTVLHAITVLPEGQNVAPNDIVNIGLHFFLKDVRPMLPPVMNHSIAVA